jgi:hypothetical protein
MADWPTIASLATASGTLVLAAATFASVRSANRAARAAERSLMAGLRPLLLASRTEDPPQKIMWLDRHFARVEGGRAVVDVEGDVIYLAGSVRNAGTGVAIIHSWHVRVVPIEEARVHGDPDTFRRQSRDLYVAPGDVGFWQGAIRDADDADRAVLLDAIEERKLILLDVVYGDQEGGQRVLTMFTLTPVDDGTWLFSASRHWNLDRQDPR